MSIGLSVKRQSTAWPKFDTGFKTPLLFSRLESRARHRFSAANDVFAWSDDHLSGLAAYRVEIERPAGLGAGRDAPDVGRDQAWNPCDGDCGATEVKAGRCLSDSKGDMEAMLGFHCANPT